VRLKVAMTFGVTALLLGCSAETPTATAATWDCSDKPYCAQIETCAEAQYRLHTCGLKRLDANGDGEACELTCVDDSGKRRSDLDGTFHGFDCTDDCSGHKAGYAWARKNRLMDGSYCPEDGSQSFAEGCMAWVNEHKER